MARKRAKGGGRKPSGEVSGLDAVISIRMPQELLERLDESAAGRAKSNRKRSRTQEILFRLNRDLEREDDARKDNATRALCYLLAELVESVKRHTAFDLRDQNAWRDDPFCYNAVKIGFDMILSALAPSGEMKDPTGDLWTDMERPPGWRLARHTAAVTLGVLLDPPRIDSNWNMDASEAKSIHYRMNQANRVLIKDGLSKPDAFTKAGIISKKEGEP